MVEHKNYLEQPIQLSKIQEAIKDLKSNKSPRTDSFMGEFYNKIPGSATAAFTTNFFQNA